MKIEITNEALDILERFSRERSQEAILIQDILKAHVNDLSNIMSVDPKGNVGLQTCARQEALKIVLSILDTIFPSDEMRTVVKTQGKQKISQFR